MATSTELHSENYVQEQFRRDPESDWYDTTFYCSEAYFEEHKERLLKRISGAMYLWDSQQSDVRFVHRTVQQTVIDSTELRRQSTS